MVIPTENIVIPRIFMIILGMLGAIGASAAELTDADKAIVGESVKKQLKDPDSARFKWLPIAGNWRGEGRLKSIIYCGVVNSKNSLGGYAGDAPYSVFLTRLKDSRAISISTVIGIGTADWESPASYAVVKPCNDEGYTNFFLAK